MRLGSRVGLLALTTAVCFYLVACGGGGGGSSSTQSNPIPSITSLSPSFATAGGAAFSMTVNGENFISSSTVQWNGSSRTTTYVSATQLKASITAADIAAAGNAEITVVNPAPGGGTSAQLGFKTNPPAPSVKLSIGPAAITVGSSATLTWTSMNATSCTAGGAWSGTRATSGTQNVTPTVAGTDPYTLTCQNSVGATATATAMLTIANPTPTGPLSQVRSFEYLIGEVTSNPGIYTVVASSSADLIILGVTTSSPPLDRAAADPSGTKLIFGYADVAEAQTYNYPSLFAGQLPSWFGNPNPGWPGVYTVQYWNPAWEPILFPLIDKNVDDGYDGMFLDVLDGYSEWSAGNPEGNPVYPNALSAMQTLVADIKTHITAKYPGKTFYLMGNYTGVPASGNVDSLKYLDAIFNESAYYQDTTSNGSLSAYVGLASAEFIRSTDARIYAATGLPVFGNDYPNPLSDASADFLSFDLYSSLGWIPSVQSPATTRTIFSTGPFMFMATPSNSTVTGYPNFLNFLSGGMTANTTLVGGNQGDYFIGGRGQNTITGGAGNDTIYAHPRNAAQKGHAVFDFSSSIAGSGTTPSVSVSVNGQEVLPPTQITVPSSTNVQTKVQTLDVDVSSYAPVSSVVITVTDASFTDQNNYSALQIWTASYNGVLLDLTTAAYSNGSGTTYTPWSANGTVTFPASSLWVTPPFLSNTSDVIDGGGGTNTVVYRGPYSNYTVTKQSDGSYLVTSKSTAEGPDTLKNIQVLVFSDQQITLQ